MPVLARPCTPDVETSKHAGHMVDAPHQKRKKKASGCHVWLGRAGPSYTNTGPRPHILVLWGRIIYLSICGAKWLPWLLRKAGPLNLNLGPWGPHPSKYGAFLLLWVCK